MKTLYLLRHAKSSWNDRSLPDYQRSLNERGKQDAPRVGELLKERGLRPDAVLSSSAKRAAKTAKKAVAASGFEVEIQLIDELYLAPPAVYLDHLGRLEDDLASVLVVGHNPGIEELFFGFTGRHEHFPTAALAQLELSIDRWRDIAADQSARVAWFWSPKGND
jgi:phosphohistidine phosphatase